MMTIIYCGIHDEEFAFGGVCPRCQHIPHGSSASAKTWELTMQLKVVCHPIEFGSQRTVNKLMQASRCRETGELRWEPVPIEQGLAVEVPR